MVFRAGCLSTRSYHEKLKKNCFEKIKQCNNEEPIYTFCINKHMLNINTKRNNFLRLPKIPIIKHTKHLTLFRFTFSGVLRRVTRKFLGQGSFLGIKAL